MKISELDLNILNKIRKNVKEFALESSLKFDKPGLRILDIAPQDHGGLRDVYKNTNVDTLDIDPSSGATYIADLCRNNESTIPSASYDLIFCSEVLEHTLNPFLAADEILRILKPGGSAWITTPFNFRIHGPLPDCWRFTEHGLRSLLSKFSSEEIRPMESEDRFLMPYQYLVKAIR